MNKAITPTVLSFCDFQDSLKDQLFDALKIGLFNVEPQELEEIYAQLKSGFDPVRNGIADQCIADNFVYRERGMHSPHASISKQYDEAKLIGIDLPTLISPPNPKGRVMILGQDPLRHEVDFPNPPFPVVVGTPWALHSAKAKEGTDRRRSGIRLMWQIVKAVTEEGYSVYLTDIVKLWLPSKRGDKKNPIIETKDQRFQTVLGAEIELIKPVKIIAFGDHAQNACKNLRDNIVLRLTHPSPSANGAWKSLIGRVDNDAKVGHILQQFNTSIRHG